VSPDNPTIAVALHDVEPATFARCAEIRAWLADRGVDRVTLLVIPARDLHPLGERSPETVEWLIERRRRGDSIAQHGFQHDRLRRGGSWRTRHAGRTRQAAEFAGLDDEEARRAVEAGRRVMKLAGIEPDGFVAPGYAYTEALRRALRERFRWWASRTALHGASADDRYPDADCRPWRVPAPAWDPGAAGRLGRAAPPALIEAGSALAGNVLRLDLHPTALESRRGAAAVERLLDHALARRRAATYVELAAGERREERTSVRSRPRTPTIRAHRRPASPRSPGEAARTGSQGFAAAKSR
jgi:Uncharacterized protein conserved in bacteria (DUF2334)